MITEILELHADEAAFLWLLRDGAALGPHYNLDGLSELDERIEAQLDGLRIGGDAGFEIAAAAGGGPGEIFTAAVLAVERGDRGASQRLAETAAGEPPLARGLVSALGWVPLEVALAAVSSLLAPDAPAALRRLGIAACAAHRHDPGEPLAYALLDADPALKARALRAAGELGRMDLVRDVRAALAHDDAGCRYWAAWSATLLGEPAATRVLWAIAGSGGPFAAPACAMAARRTEPSGARHELRSLAALPARARIAAIGYGALGDPAGVPWLLEAMADPALARIAGEAFAMITGIAIEQRLAGARPEGLPSVPSDDPADPNVAMDPDEKLPWPAPGAIAAAFRECEGRFRRGARYLLGEPVGPAGLGRALREGMQRQRAAAAIERAIERPGQALFEVRAPAARQREALRKAQAAAPRAPAKAAAQPRR